jgi:hypothetical protein
MRPENRGECRPRQVLMTRGSRRHNRLDRRFSRKIEAFLGPIALNKEKGSSPQDYETTRCPSKQFDVFKDLSAA